jgi:probable O-glycosylation ligase (exosortase A-associated)
VRGVLLQLYILSLVPTTFYAPHVGILAYYWYSWMAPQKLAWGLWPIDWGKVIALSALAAWLFSREPKKLPAHPITVLVVLLFFWTGITTVFARHPDPALTNFQEFAKIVLMFLVTTAVITTRIRLHALIWTVVISIGYYGFKGGAFTLIAGGNYSVLGPPGTVIWQTNEVARAFLMVFPLSFYLWVHSSTRLVRLGMLAVTAFIVLALLGTNSRGALVGLAAMCFYAWLLSRYKIRILLATSAVVLAGYLALPQARLDGLIARYSSIEDYETDVSYQGRVGAWNFAIEYVGTSPIFGGGFSIFEFTYGKASHNNYFQVLGEHGMIGLALYLTLVVVALVAAARLMRRCRGHPELYWARDLAVMLQAIFIGYLVGGITKNHAFFEMYYMQLGMLIAAIRIVQRELSEKQAGAAARPQAAAVMVGAAQPASGLPGLRQGD